MRIAYHMMSSPVGLLFLARTENGLRYVDFMDRKSLKRMIARHSNDYPDATWEPSLLDLRDAVDELDEYFTGQRYAFTVPLDLVGSDFQIQVWKALCEIPFGETRTYGQIAKTIGQPKAARAVGLANNQNPIPVIVPCHRVIGANGKLTGYGGGIHRKKWLIQHEARFAKESSVGELFAGVGDKKSR